ncbi:MAG TPA: IS630 family transposase [Nitrospira sp.]|nr:IS630 family transposase [Nitrospira sp.]
MCGRENRDPGAGPQGFGAAPVARAGRTAWLRVLPTRGTLSLYAAFNTKAGEVLGKTADRNTSEQFTAFLTDLVAHQPQGKEIHVIADNLSAHKTTRVTALLQTHAKVRLHVRPTYSLWLNQVELWFAKIERDVIARGVFTSVKDLEKKLMRYIRHYNTVDTIVKWKYGDPSRHIGPQSSVTSHQFVSIIVLTRR